MGVVYEATQLSLDRPVAPIKVLRRDLSADGEFRERFRREGIAQARFDHPHVIPVHHFGEHAGRLYLVMRLVPGPTLEDRIRAGDLSAGETLRILAPVAQALDAAHEHGLVHRDVKPSNVIIAPGEHPYLLDFGIAKDRRRDAHARGRADRHAGLDVAGAAPGWGRRPPSDV